LYVECDVKWEWYVNLVLLTFDNTFM